MPAQARRWPQQLSRFQCRNTAEFPRPAGGVLISKPLVQREHCTFTSWEPTLSRWQNFDAHMPTPARAQLLRQRFKALYPAASRPPVELKPKPAKKEPKPKGYICDHLGPRLSFPHRVQWIETREGAAGQQKLTPQISRKAKPSPLTAISEKLKRGAAVWSKHAAPVNGSRTGDFHSPAHLT